MLRLTRAPALAVTIALAGLAGCRDSSSSTGSAASSGAASSAEVRAKDAGGLDFVLGDRALPLPPNEIDRAPRAPVVQDATGKRFAFPVSPAEHRLVYAVGKGLYLGPRVKAPLDFGAAPDRDHALGALFENAEGRRAALLADLQADGGDALVATALTQGADVDAPEWDEAFAKLPAARAGEVRSALAKLLETGQPTAGLDRAVVLVPLREPGRAAGLTARLRELADGIRAPRASAVMLRALAALDVKQGSAVACEILAKKPLDTKHAKGTAREVDRPGREALAEAAALALASDGATCAELPALLGDDACQPWFRCGSQGPLDGHEASAQAEPLCTAEQLAPLVGKELERAPKDVIALTSGSRASLFAYEALAEAGSVPAAFLATHARRRYALTQPAQPSCEAGGALGSPCHCDEATVRDQICRRPEATVVSVGTCKFDVDDRAKKITNVVVTSPP
ncbi:MAG: hypothetical protein JWP97_3762 [Labilithrix sp.]|nr:hypothetical protein [Labilithrix sp.]